MHCSAPIMAGNWQEIRLGGGGYSSSSLCISIHQLPPEKIVVLRASEAGNPYPNLRLAKAKATTPAPKRAAVDPVSGTEENVALNRWSKDSYATQPSMALPFAYPLFERYIPQYEFVVVSIAEY